LVNSASLDKSSSRHYSRKFKVMSSIPKNVDTIVDNKITSLR
jgi:hypothetical protein